MSMTQTKLKIRYYGDSCLRKRARPVEAVEEKDRLLAREMIELMRISGGIGLAAPQIGIDKQILVLDIGKGPYVLFNPRVMKKSGSETMQEGCLSLPGIYVKVRRAKKVVVRGLSENNEGVSLCASELMARVLQHEIEHLRGRLIIDHAGFLAKIRLRKKFKALVKEHNTDLKFK